MRGTVDGVRFIAPELMDEAAKEQAAGTCAYLGPVSMGLGFGRYHEEYFPVSTPSSFGWGGLGGSVGIADPVSAMSLGYAPNNFQIDVTSLGPRQQRFADAFAEVAQRQ